MGTFIRVDVDEAIEVSSPEPGNVRIETNGEGTAVVTFDSLMAAIKILGMS